MYSVQTIRTQADWQLHRERFNALAGKYFTRGFAWLGAWWEVYQRPHRELNILAVLNASTVVAYLPLYVDHTMPERRLELLGSGKICSDDLGFYCAAGHEQKAAHCVVQHLYGEGLAGAWDSLQLEGIRNDCPAMQSLLMSLRECFGSDLRENVDQVCREIRLSNSMDNYIRESMSHGQRNKMRRQIKTYIDSGRFEPRIAKSLDEAIFQVESVCALHASRWQSKGEQGCTSTDGFCRFVETACQALWQDGTWFSALYYLDGELAAGLLGALSSERLSVYMTGIAPALIDHRPGILMNLSAIQYAISQGCEIYDLMRGDEVYKSRLGALAVPQFTWNISAPRAWPRFKGRIRQTKEMLRLWLKDASRELPIVE